MTYTLYIPTYLFEFPQVIKFLCLQFFKLMLQLNKLQQLNTV